MNVDNKGSRTRNIALTAMFAAITVVFMWLSVLISFNTIFFLALASFMTGIIGGALGIGWGAALAAVSFSAGLIASPDKLYPFTYLMFSIYVLVEEYLVERADNRSNMYSGPVESRGKSSGRNRTGEWEESRQYRTGESKDSGQDETGEGNGTCQEETDESKAESKASGKSGKAAYIRDLVLKFALFNIMYITALLVYSKLFGLDPLFDGTVFEKFGIAGSRPLVWLILFIMGQIAWLIFDKAYIIIARGFSGKIRRLFRWQ